MKQKHVISWIKRTLYKHIVLYVNFSPRREQGCTGRNTMCKVLDTNTSKQLSI